MKRKKLKACWVDMFASLVFTPHGPPVEVLSFYLPLEDLQELCLCSKQLFSTFQGSVCNRAVFWIPNWTPPIITTMMYHAENIKLCGSRSLFAGLMPNTVKQVWVFIITKNSYITVNIAVFSAYWRTV